VYLRCKYFIISDAATVGGTLNYWSLLFLRRPRATSSTSILSSTFYAVAISLSGPSRVVSVALEKRTTTNWEEITNTYTEYTDWTNTTAIVDCQKSPCPAKIIFFISNKTDEFHIDLAAQVSQSYVLSSRFLHRRASYGHGKRKTDIQRRWHRDQQSRTSK